MKIPETSLTVKPPIAPVKPVKLSKHGDIRVDNYYWMNDRNNPEVIRYLEEENAYYQKVMQPTAAFQERLYLEMKARIKEDDTTVPYFYNGYYYMTRYEAGKDYPIYTRRRGSLRAEEEILFDCNLLAAGLPYFHLGGLSVSPDNRYAAFAVDTVGRRIYNIGVRDLLTGQLLPDVISNTTGGAVWGNDNQTLFYTRQDAVTLRSHKVFRHILHTAESSDKLIFEEKDDRFHIEVGKSKSRKYIFIESTSTLTTETRYLQADKPLGRFLVFQKRKRGVEYSVSHFGNQFYIHTNIDEAENFKLMVTPETATGREHWSELIPHRPDVLLEDIEIFRDFLVVEERANGLNQIQIRPWNGDQPFYLPFGSETYSAFTTANVDFDTDLLRYSYQSLATPPSVIDFNMKTGERIVLKEQQVLGGSFNKENYIEKRIWAPALDGTMIPISLVHHKDVKLSGENPTLLYAYGSYGASMDPYFSSTRLSLLDRGFVYAIAHVRGGEDLGRSWYESGKLMQKKNTFTDFIDCSLHLIAEGYTSSEHLYAEGGSAGGLLMGVVVNMAPQLYKGVIAQVPFVDVLTTMLDESVPLTTGEYDEWGNPNEKDFYKYMKSYSPYDNVAPQNYPHMYVSTGLHDSQVQYWEPAKWVAKLRATKTDNNLLFLDTNMEAGHGGASGRFQALKELAKEFCFLLTLEGIEI